MLKFILRRILEAIPTMLVLITVSFFLMRFAPGSPFSSERTLPPQVMANINAKYGLDKPVFDQYTTYLTNVIQGDFGPSFKYKDFTVNELVASALPVSAKIGAFAFIFAVFFWCLSRDACGTTAKYMDGLYGHVYRHAGCRHAFVCISTVFDLSVFDSSELVPCGWLVRRII